MTWCNLTPAVINSFSEINYFKLYVINFKKHHKQLYIEINILITIQQFITFS